MTLPQLHIVKKIKFFVSNAIRTKKQVVDDAQIDATEHHRLNQKQERDDEDIIDRAKQELKEEEKK